MAILLVCLCNAKFNIGNHTQMGTLLRGGDKMILNELKFKNLSKNICLFYIQKSTFVYGWWSFNSAEFSRLLFGVQAKIYLLLWKILKMV